MSKNFIFDSEHSESSGTNIMHTYQEVRDKMLAQERHYQEMEQLRKQITEDVLAQIRIQLKTEGIKELNDLLNGLGK